MKKKEKIMANRDKHKKRSHRSYANNMRQFASHARDTAIKSGQKKQQRNFFNGIKDAMTKMFHKNKEG